MSKVLTTILYFGFLGRFANHSLPITAFITLLNGRAGHIIKRFMGQSINLLVVNRYLVMEHLSRYPLCTGSEIGVRK